MAKRLLSMLGMMASVALFSFERGAAENSLSDNSDKNGVSEDFSTGAPYGHSYKRSCHLRPCHTGQDQRRTGHACRQLQLFGTRRVGDYSALVFFGRAIQHT